MRWWGHACFEVRSSLTMVFDPHDGGGIGLSAPRVKADIVLASHRHYDHADGIRLVAKEGAQTIVGEPGEREVGGVRIKGVLTFHDPEEGRLRGVNVVYVVETEGIRLCHLGDLGHIPSDGQLREIGDVDIAFVPVGGVYTIDAREADEVIKRMRPRIVVPMHYFVRGLRVRISGVEDFLKNKTNIRMLRADSFEVRVEDLPEETEIWVLELGG